MLPTFRLSWRRSKEPFELSSCSNILRRHSVCSFTPTHGPMRSGKWSSHDSAGFDCWQECSIPTIIPHLYRCKLPFIPCSFTSKGKKLLWAQTSKPSSSSPSNPSINMVSFQALLSDSWIKYLGICSWSCPEKKSMWFWDCLVLSPLAFSFSSGQASISRGEGGKGS